MAWNSLRTIMLAAVFITSPACAGLPELTHRESPNSLNDLGVASLIPVENARIIYVSDSHGNDSTGRIYSAKDPEVGADPRQPKGPIKAFKTFTAAYRHIREGEPDWILVKRGNNFYGYTAGLSRRPPPHDFVVGAAGWQVRLHVPAL